MPGIRSRFGLIHRRTNVEGVQGKGPDDGRSSQTAEHAGPRSPLKGFKQGQHSCFVKNVGLEKGLV